MKRLLLLAAIALPAFAAGTVQVSNYQLGNTNTWVAAFNWTADAGNGSVPQTKIPLATCCQGYNVSVVETVPGSPAPTAGYAVAITDGAGVDVLGGSAVALSASTAQSFPASPAATPIQGTLTLVLTGNSVASAKGVVYVFLSKPGQINAINFRNPSVATGYVLDANAIASGGAPYPTLASACTAANAVGATLVVSLRWNNLLTQSFSCPMMFLAGGILQESAGAVLTFSNTFDCPVNQQCIDFATNGGGTPVWTQGTVAYISVNWLGATCGSSTAQDAYANKAIAAAVNVAPVLFPCNTSIKNLVVPASNLPTPVTRVTGSPGVKLTCKTLVADGSCVELNATGSANQTLIWEPPIIGVDASGTTTNAGNGLRVRGSSVAKLITPPTFYAEGFRGTPSSCVWLSDLNNSSIQGEARYCYVGWRMDGLNSGFAVSYINVRNYNALLAGFYGMLLGANSNITLNLEGNNEKWDFFCGGCSQNPNFTVRSEGGNHSGTAGLYSTQFDTGDVPGLYPGFSFPSTGNTITGGNAGANSGFNFANNGAQAMSGNVLFSGNWQGGIGAHVDSTARKNAFRYNFSTVANSDKTTEICGATNGQACNIGGTQSAAYYIGNGTVPQLAGGFNEGGATAPSIVGDSWVSRITVGDGAGANYGNVVVTNPTTNNPICTANDESTGYRTVTVRPLSSTLVQLHASSNWTNGQTVTLMCGYHAP